MKGIRRHTKMLTLGSSGIHNTTADDLWNLIALCSDLHWREDTDGKCLSLRCNDTIENKTLFSTLPGKTIYEFGFSAVDDKQHKAYQSSQVQRQSFSNYICKLVDGVQLRYFSISGEPLFDIANQFIGYNCLAQDISRQKETENSLRRFRAAVDTSSDMIYLVDAETMRFVDVNDTACENAGLSREKMLTMGPEQMLSQDKDTVAKRYEMLITTGISHCMESQVLDRDGKPGVVEVSSRAVLIGGRWIIIGMSRDITLRKQAEDTSLRLRQMFSALSESNEAILRATSIESLYQNVCKAAVKGGKFNIATVITPDESGWLKSVATAGSILNIMNSVKISIDAEKTEGQGLSGIAYRTQTPCVSNDFVQDKRTRAWHEIALKNGIASAAAFPLFKRKICVGILLFYSVEKNSFDEDIVKLLSNMAENVSYALDSFESETDRKQAEIVLRESEERFRSLTHLSSDFYWEQNAELYFTKYEGNIVGESNIRAVETIIGNQIWSIDRVTPGATSWDSLKSTMINHEKFRDFECSFTNDSDDIYHLSLSGEPIFNDEGLFTGYRGISRDVTARKRVSDHIKYLATHDHLTKLPNRVMFSELLELATRTAKRYKNQTFAILFIDLDRFKSINDTYGHHVGDDLLKEVAIRLRKPLRASDVVARLGGDEFVILLQNIDQQEQIAKISGNLLKAFTNPIILNGKECRVTASIGISIFGRDADDEETLMKHADAAMYVAKEEGKNNFQFYSSDIHQMTQEKINLELNLRSALEQHEFSLHYQAKLDLQSGEVTGVEALLRWDNEHMGSIAPDRFIPVAEESGLIIDIGNWVLHTACQQMIDWDSQGIGNLRLAVNLSARQFNDPDLLNKIKHALDTSGLAPHMLELEITESVVIHNPKRAFMVMSQIKELGVKLALDDFGTGYSSLGQLKNYPIDTLKIDRTFIFDIPANEEDKAICKAIISMGNTLGLRIVAEGVEQDAQLHFLRDHHCNEVQGFFIHKPGAAENFTRWYRLHDHQAFRC